MFKNKKLLIFDLDGVLIDSIPNMRLALKQTAYALNLNLSFEEYKKNIGLPFEDIMRNMGINKNIPLIKKKYIFFSNQNLHKIKIKKKSVQILEKLKHNFKLAIFTSKDAKRTKKILSKYRIFDYILTSDDVKRGKPYPDGLKKIIKFFKLKRSDVIFIGDSVYDYKCANSAKVSYCHVLWGYHKLKNYNNIYKIKKISEILF